MTAKAECEHPIPDGEYSAIWGGYGVKANVHGVCIEMKTTEVGIRTLAAPSTVTVKDGKITVRTD